MMEQGKLVNHIQIDFRLSRIFFLTKLTSKSI